MICQIEIKIFPAKNVTNTSKALYMCLNSGILGKYCITTDYNNIITNTTLQHYNWLQQHYYKHYITTLQLITTTLLQTLHYNITTDYNNIITNTTLQLITTTLLQTLHYNITSDITQIHLKTIEKNT